MKEQKNEKKELNEAELISIKRLRSKGLQYYEIAARIGISEERVRAICNKYKNR